MKIRGKDIVDASFELSLLIKGIDGLLEITGGFLLLYLNPNRMSHLVTVITQHEFSEDLSKLPPRIAKGRSAYGTPKKCAIIFSDHFKLLLN